MRAELRREVLLLGAGAESNDLVAHLVGVLHGEMAEAAESLDGDDFPGDDLELADGIEDGDPGAENWCVPGREKC